MTAYSRPIGDSYQYQERLLFHDYFESLCKPIPILLIENAHKIEK